MSSPKWIPGMHPRTAVVMHDLGMVMLAWWAAKSLRYALMPSLGPASFVPPEFPLVLLIQGGIFAWTGLYKGLWRFASVPDLWNIIRATVAGGVLIGLTLFLYDRLLGVPRSVLLMYPLILAALLGVPRLAYRFWKDTRRDLVDGRARKRVLILGANRSGDALVRDLARNRGPYEVIGFLDDDAGLRGSKLHGLPVLGPLDDMAELSSQVAADMLLIAQPTASAQQMRRIVELCERSGLPFRTIPRLEDVVAGRAAPDEIKEVAIEDLLGRDPVDLDWTRIAQSIGQHRVLVTGGGGSIGAELCRQVARLRAASLTIVEISEFNLYRIERELRANFPELELHLILADSGDAVAMEHLFAARKPQVVLHAAAYKHVPMLQGQLREAFRNNVMATRCVADLADRHEVGRFVLISTDKAVNPTSVMGACKRMAEIWCQNLAQRSRTKFITVRFGNVLDSAGSVVPLFREQIAKGGPVTITHPDVSRYFMTIPEACQLILQAATLGEGGEIFALDMGEPIKIRDLATQMIRLTGKQAGSEIPVVYTGLRSGEKLFEELFHPLENYVATTHAKIFLSQPRLVAWDLLVATMDRALDAVAMYDEDLLRRQVSTLLPSFRWNDAAQPTNVVPMHRIDKEGAA